MLLSRVMSQGADVSPRSKSHVGRERKARVSSLLVRLLRKEGSYRAGVQMWTLCQSMGRTLRQPIACRGCARPAPP